MLRRGLRWPGDAGNFYKTSFECLAFWQSNTLSALLAACYKCVFVFGYSSYGKRVRCEETCTLVSLQWIMHLFRDHALPNEHPSLLKKSANILWRSGKWHTLTNARCNSAHKKSQMDSSNKFLLLLSASWLIYDTTADVSNFIKICPISSTPKGEFSDLPWVCAHLLQVVFKLKPKC